MSVRGEICEAVFCHDRTQLYMTKVVVASPANGDHDGRGPQRTRMPTFSQSLEQSLHRALAIANERHHQYATLEHLLLSLIDDSDAAAVMRACSVDLDKLRSSLVNYLETEFENLVTDGADDAKPTAGFQRVLQRAVIHVQSSGREEVTGANVLIAIFSERESHAVYYLQGHDRPRGAGCLLHQSQPESAGRPDRSADRPCQ